MSSKKNLTNVVIFIEIAKWGDVKIAKKGRV